MLTEPMTLYKLMNLYLLKQVNFPLTNAQHDQRFLQNTTILLISHCSRP